MTDKAEIERLTNSLSTLKSCYESLTDMYESAKSEAIKDFAERLKEKATSTFYEEHKYVDTEDIDNLVKEMVGDVE